MSDQIVIYDNVSNDTIFIGDSAVPNIVNVNIDTSLVFSVNGRVGHVYLSKNDVQLDQVDNTSDLNKPLSIASIIALSQLSDLTNTRFYFISTTIDNLSATVENTLINLSGAIDVDFNALSSTVDYIFNSLSSTVDTKFYFLSSTIDTQFNSLSTTIDTQFYFLSSTIDTEFSGLSSNLDTQLDSLSSSVDSLTLNYNVTSYDLNLSNDANTNTTINLISLGYKSYETMAETIEEFAASNIAVLQKGYTVKLFNNRVYIFAGTDQTNPNHYLEVNLNPHKIIFHEIPQTTNQYLVDSFYLGDFKSAKYTLQVETNYNNDLYYSEINAIGSVGSNLAIVCEYGQLYTSEFIMGYQADVESNILNFYINFAYLGDGTKKLIVKGHRTNFYRL
jgi:hypothetical protein